MRLLAGLRGSVPAAALAAAAAVPPQQGGGAAAAPAAATVSPPPPPLVHSSLPPGIGYDAASLASGSGGHAAAAADCTLSPYLTDISGPVLAARDLTAVRNLYALQPFRCGVCGVRFPVHDDCAAHVAEAHPTEAGGAAGGGPASARSGRSSGAATTSSSGSGGGGGLHFESRQWFVPVDMWVQHGGRAGRLQAERLAARRRQAEDEWEAAGVDDSGLDGSRLLGGGAGGGDFASGGSGGGGTAGAGNLSPASSHGDADTEHVVPASRARPGAVCPVCGEGFSRAFDGVREEWVLTGAVEVPAAAGGLGGGGGGARILHFLCT